MTRVTVISVDSDDYGDTRFKHYIEVFKGKKLIWTDYWPYKPTRKQVLKSIEELTK